MDTLKLIYAIEVIFYNIFGNFGNFHLVYLTIFRQELRSKSAYLQAITSFSHAVCLLNQLPNVAFFLLNFELSRNQCVFVATPYILCANIQCVMMLFILIDSILMISFPIWYRNLGTFKYVLAMFLPSLASGLFFAIAAFLMLDSTRVPVCSGPNAKRHALETEVANVTRRLRAILFIYLISWFTGGFGNNITALFLKGIALQYATSNMPGEDVMKRTWHGLTYDFRRWKRRYDEARKDAFKRRHPIAHMKHSVLDQEVFPFRAEILIIGGGLTGSSTAYWLKERFRDEDFKVVVIEDNDTFPANSSLLSTGGITQQFAIPEYIDMSLFTVEFLRHAGEHLQILDSEKPDINFLPTGLLKLATTEAEADKMRDAWKIQVEKGAKVLLLAKNDLAERFPEINFDGVILGSLGLENEGTIDTWRLLSAIREKNITLGVQYVKAKLEGFEFERKRANAETHAVDDPDYADDNKWRDQRLSGVLVRPQMNDSSARPIRAHLIVNAAGPWAGEIAKMAGMGMGKGILAVPLPVKPRKRDVFVVYAPDVPVDIPAIVEPSGIYCRQFDVGNTFLVGKSPSLEEDAKIDHSRTDVDYDLFYKEIWPTLVDRVPGFQTAKVKSAWTGKVDVNTFDGAPVIGEHPLYPNLHMMCGFGERGAMHSLAAGRSYAEKIFEGAYINVNLRKFDMRRIIKMDRSFAE
ncbi:unnamed protein product [Caenorhabditis auriculariae]|uniref:FAD-dependent oxidoreductase domain-containing protein 1 n=1 Tax=Caenorhabditis auriculariae TaxID=2777116 RepID=A0A8S1H614_9PELO|nr:unnamed protein product [Caenorhabditis auriculariae]